MGRPGASRPAATKQIMGGSDRTGRVGSGRLRPLQGALIRPLRVAAVTTAPIPATCELWVDGVRYADGHAAGENPLNPFAISGLKIAWGRETTVDQPDPATCTFTIIDPPGGTTRFDATVKLGSTVVVWTELNGQRAVVFGGRVTDLSSTWNEGAGSGQCDVVAADLMSDLGNRFVGAEPWVMETALNRAKRILAAVGVSSAGLNMSARPAAINVTRMDVDRQAAAGLLTALGNTTGSVVWSAYDPARSGPYLYFEDPSLRASLYVFNEDTTSLLWAPAPGMGAGAELSSCQVLADPVEWVRAVTDLITRVTVRWQDQTTAPGTTERSVSIINTAAEKTYGARGLSVGTGLTTSDAADSLANALLASHQPGPAWRTNGLTWDLSKSDPADAAAQQLAFNLLGNVTRLGYPIALVDLPYWTPTAAAVQLYVEGGEYSFTDGYWTMALIAAPATGLGASLSYGATDLSVRYVDVNRTVTYLSMTGVGPAGPTGQHWDALPGTWEQLPGKWSDQ